jgi:hypothetical protein
MGRATPEEIKAQGPDLSTRVDPWCKLEDERTRPVRGAFSLSLLASGLAYPMLHTIKNRVAVHFKQ